MKSNTVEKLSKRLNQSTENVGAQAAVVLLLREKVHGFEVLLVKRAEKETDPWSGQIALPGGKRDRADKDIKETAVRETVEETSINLLEGSTFWGAMEAVRSTQKPEMQIVPFVFFEQKQQPIELNEELTGYFWTQLKELPKNRGTLTYKGKEHPTYVLKGSVVWGLTYKILSSFLLLLETFDGTGNSS